MKNKATAIGVAIGVPLLGVLLIMCTFTHRPYEEPVVTRFGAVTDPVRLGWNWHLKLPTPIDSVRLIDMRIRSFRTDNQEYSLQAEGLVAAEKLQIRVYCHWQVTDARQYYRRYYDNEVRATEIIRAKIVDALRAQLQNRTLDRFFNQIEDKVKQREMEINVRNRINKECRDGELGLRVASVGFYRISFPPTVFQSICDAMVSEQIQQATAYEKQGEEAAESILSEARRKATIIVGEAKADAELIEKTAQAESEAIYRKAIAHSPELWNYDQALETAATVLRKKSQVTLNVADWPFLRALLDPDSFAAPGEATTRPTTRPAAD